MKKMQALTATLCATPELQLMFVQRQKVRTIQTHHKAT